MNSDNSWEEDDAVQGFADANSTKIVVGMHWHAEALRQKLETILLESEEGLLECSFSFPLPQSGAAAHTRHVLNNSALPFVAKGAQKEDEVGKLIAEWVKTVEEKLPLMMGHSNCHNSRIERGILGFVGERMNFKASLSSSKEAMAIKSEAATRGFLSLESFDDS